MKITRAYGSPLGLRLVAEVGAEKDARSNRCGTSKIEYVTDQIWHGRIWVEPQHAAKLTVRQELQVDRYLCTVTRVGRAQSKWCVDGPGKNEQVDLCPVYLS